MKFILSISRPKLDGWHFSDSFFKCIFFNENYDILIEISIKFVCIGPVNYNNKKNIGSCDGLAPNNQQAIVWIVMSKFTDVLYIWASVC